MLVFTIASIPLVAAGAGRWRPGFGDPTTAGWTITVAYLVAVLLCFRSAWRAGNPSAHDKRYRIFWWGCGALMLFLCLNKQLDFQVLLTQTGRDLSIALGWYEQRRTIQALFFLFMTAVSLAALLATYWHIEGAPRHYYLALGGLVFTGTFVLLRAAAMHHFAEYFGFAAADSAKHEFIEFGGIAIVGIAAVLTPKYGLSLPHPGNAGTGDSE